MPEIAVYENENAFLDFTLKYGPSWHDTALRGTAIATAHTSEVYFYVSQTVNGAAVITRTVTNLGIEWLNATDGRIRVKLSTQTNTYSGDNLFYELRVKFSDGSYVTADSGTFHIRASNVDRP